MVSLQGDSLTSVCEHSKDVFGPNDGIFQDRGRFIRKHISNPWCAYDQHRNRESGACIQIVEYVKTGETAGFAVLYLFMNVSSNQVESMEATRTNIFLDFRWGVFPMVFHQMVPFLQKYVMFNDTTPPQT